MRQVIEDMTSVSDAIHAICVALIVDDANEQQGEDTLSGTTRNHLVSAIQHLTDRQRSLAEIREIRQ